MSIYYINLQVTNEMTEEYSSDDLFSLAKQQQNKIVLFDSEIQAESEAQTQREEYKKSQLVCSVLVLNDPDNDELNGTTVRASALDYYKVISTFEYVALIAKEQSEKEESEPAIIKRKRQKFVPPRKNNITPKEKEAVQLQIQPEENIKIEKNEITFYVVLPEANIKTDEYTEDDLILLAKKQDKNILIVDKKIAIQMAEDHFKESGTPQLIFEIKSAQMLGKHLELHKDFQIQGLQFIAETSAKKESPLKLQLPNTFTTAHALYQKRKQQRLDNMLLENGSMIISKSVNLK